MFHKRAASLLISLAFLLPAAAFSEVEEIEGSDLDGSYVEGISIEILEKTAEFDKDDEDLKELQELIITNKDENRPEEASLLQTQLNEKLLTVDSPLVRDQMKDIIRNYETPSSYDPSDTLLQDGSKTFITFEGVNLPEQNNLEFQTELINLINTPTGAQLQVNTPQGAPVK